jgi:hypothetical protein
MISITENNKIIHLKLDISIFNSSKTHFDLLKLQKAITLQLAQVYNVTIADYKLSLTCTIKTITKKTHLSPTKILIQIVDSLSGNNPAEADFGGLRIKLNKLIVADIINGKNTRTIPHEIGHLLGWNHPHANATYQSVNKNATELEKELTEDERIQNLMSQTWYAQKAGIPLDKAMKITTQQLELLKQNFKKGLLNKNYHLNYFLFWKKLVD